jgi:hypothetical protein
METVNIKVGGYSIPEDFGLNLVVAMCIKIDLGFALKLILLKWLCLAFILPSILVLLHSIIPLPGQLVLESDMDQS